MARTRRPSRPFPSKDAVVAFVEANPGLGNRRGIARAFGLDSSQRIALREMLRELADEGVIERRRGRRLGRSGQLPPVAMVEVTGTDTDGEVLARPIGWEGEGKAPLVFMAPERRGHPALAAGDRVLARLRRQDDGSYVGHTIRRAPEAPETVLGIYTTAGGQGRLRPVDRRHRGEFAIARSHASGARPGELVQAHVLGARRLGLREARVIERLGAPDHPHSVSLIAVHDHGIAVEFDEDALAEAAVCGAAPLAAREDLRAIALVTIDGEDARDFDDAVWAEPDADAANRGGWHLVVAIADVAWYVRPGGALDRTAFERGNSVYFPDRVVPMLPEALSNGWCSLKPDQDRPCLAAHLWIDGSGRLLRHRFARALMRSAARLTYGQVQRAADGAPDRTTAPLMADVVRPLYGAYGALAGERRRRGVLELDVPERQVVLADDGSVASVAVRDRYDSHRLIEEFMIAANVAAAETLERCRQPAMYRVHDKPTREKLEALREFLESLGLTLARGPAIGPLEFNRVLAKVAGTPHQRLVHEVVLRSQAQAQYAPGNIGHFGLALARYCHFTSPIRRYADLLVHRALIRGLGLGEGGLEPHHRDFARMGEHISMTERRAAEAERDTVDRFVAGFLADRVGATFRGRINGVTRFGLFVTLADTGGDGLVPIRTLPSDYYVHDPARHELVGRNRGRRFRLGETVTVRLVEADPVTGGLVLHLAQEDEGPDRAPRRIRGAPRRR